jgi:hypothetical protein
MLLPCGADKCPECSSEGTLTWVDEDKQEMDAKHLDCLVPIRKLELQEYLSPEILKIVLKEVDADDYVLRKDNCCEDFMAGAEWRINSVWYDAREKPDKGKLLIAEDIDGAYDLVYSTKSKPWEELSEKNHYMRWAYVEDLIP